MAAPGVCRELCLYGMLHVRAPSPDDKLTFPGYDGANAAINFILVVMATLIMSRIERRPFDVYGLPWRNVLRSRIWAGMLAGFAIIAFVLLCVFAFHGFEICCSPSSLRRRSFSGAIPFRDTWWSLPRLAKERGSQRSFRMRR
jgi:hypothetical protein